MSLYRFKLQTLQKVRQYIKDALAFPDVEHKFHPTSGFGSLDDLPEPDSVDELSDLFTWGGAPEIDSSGFNATHYWEVSTVNPGAALLKLPGLYLQPHIRLVSYLYRAEDSGVGVVWAVPEDLGTTAQLEKVIAPTGGIAQVPKPAGVLDHFMDAVGGDRTPPSFIVASILRRELQEFGMIGKRCNWSRHRLVETIPPDLTWQWRSEQPKDLSPKVKVLPDQRVAVEFFSCRIDDATTLYRHVEQYPANSYRAESIDKSVGVAKP